MFRRNSNFYKGECRVQGYSSAWSSCVNSQPQQLAVSDTVQRPAGKLSTSPTISGFTGCSGQQETSSLLLKLAEAVAAMS